ncbi:uncharacterized protein LOC111264783 isoform X2 [Varroa jacobsoni]|uniref:uncharacterized protein LOC111264783 isoform X2 n=1 Tax=Varroa jacobsoni TaxID=62625 RepID=UPI000BF89A0D|nr:uncharacterized protein LOC111264783 isoform X2 [Varroa jacobsoni]
MMRSENRQRVHLRFIRPLNKSVDGSGIFLILLPCMHFLRLYAIKLTSQKEKSLYTCLEWSIRIILWLALLFYGAVGVLSLFTLFAHAKKGTTLLSSEGLHMIVAYETVIVLLGRIFSLRRRQRMNEYLIRLEKSTRSKELPVLRVYRVLLYVLLTLLFIHSACLTFTTSMLQYKVIASEKKVISLPAGNAGAGEEKVAAAAGGAPPIGGADDRLQNGDVIGIKNTGLDILPDSNVGPGLESEPEVGGFSVLTENDLNSGSLNVKNDDKIQDSPLDFSSMKNSDAHDNRPAEDDPGAQMKSSIDIDGMGDEYAVKDKSDEFGRQRRRKRDYPDDVVELARPAAVIEMSITAQTIEEDEQESFPLSFALTDDDEILPNSRQAANNGNVLSIVRGNRLSRARRGLIDTAIDDSIDNDDINFIELFKPFSLIINGIRYLLIKNIIYLSAILVSCFCVIICQTLIQINQQLSHKIIVAKLSTELLADIRQAYAQCISLLGNVERNFSIVLVLNLVLTLAFQTILTEAAASARMQALQTVDLVTVGIASVPPNRIKAHQQAELLVSIATIQDPGLTAWDIVSYSRTLGYSILGIAYIVVLAHIQFLRDGKWRTVFGTILQRQDSFRSEFNER